MHTEEDDVPITPKKKLDKGQSSSDTADSSDKSDPKKTDGEDPKPRIVLTFRSDKKNCNMKIVPNDEKHEESSPSPRRSTRSRHKWEWSEDAEMSISPKKEKNSSQSVSENDEASDSSHATPKRLTRGRSKESSDNVLANAIARKEKSYNEAAPGPTQRLSRRIKPTAKILANEELRIGLESQNNARLGLQSDKPEEGVRTRKSARSMPPEVDLTQVTPAMYLLDRNKKETRSSKAVEEEEAPEDVSDEAKQSPNTVMKLKHLCELGLKAINPETMEDEAVELDDEEDEGQEEEEYENEELEEDEDEIDDDSEVISKLLEADDDDDSDEDFSCSAEVSQAKRPRRSTRLCSSYGESELAPFTVDDDQKEEYNYRPSRKRSRRNEEVPVEEPEESKSNRDVLPRRAKNTDPWKRSDSKTPDTQSVVNIPDDNDEPAGGDEGSEAACPEDEASTAATCFCETPSNIYAAPGELTEPVFCQAIETVDGVRVGCSHAAAREDGTLRPLLRAGPRAPFVLTCTVHAAQLRAHMCCPNCGLFCTQGTFYQCSLGHLFHLECGLPHSRWNRWSSDAKARPGCPHCGVGARRWTPRNSACRRVALRMDCSNKRIFLPDQREQCDAKARPGCPHCGVGARRWTPRNSACRRVALRMDCSNKRIFLPDQREQCDAKARPGCPHCGVGARRWTPRNSACRRVALRMDCSNKRIFLPDQREQCACLLPLERWSSDAKARPGCPHCGVGARRWTPRNSACRRVALRMDCSNKRIFLPDQREQCDAKARPGCPHCGVGARRWTPRNSACRRVALRMDCSNKRIFLPDQREQCDAKARPGCPHCGVGARRWTPRNSACRRVALRMDCSNKRIFLPDQREQCTPAYLGFTSLSKPQEEPTPLIPEDLLPSPPIDLKALCESNAAKCDPSRSPAQSLCDAILAGESIQQLLPKIAAARSTINEQITSLMGGTCVHAACKRADVAALYLLQYAGADLCAADNALRTPLVLAAQCEYPYKYKRDDAAALYLLQYAGADLCAADNALRTPLVLAAQCEYPYKYKRDDAAALYALQYAGADLCAADNALRTPLVLAAQCEYPYKYKRDDAAALYALQYAGADLCAADNALRTPLVLAAQCEYPYKYKRDDAAALYALQYAGADLCAADNALRTPLVLAAQCEYPYKYKRDDAAALYALQYAGADLCAADNALRTPLVLAAQCEYPYKYKRDDAAALYALQYAGADLCAADNALRTPLVLAAQCEYPYKYKRDDAAALYALQYAGADLCAADNALRTPLVLAAQCEYPYKYKRDDAAALYALQYAGADLCAADNALRTPLVLAAQCEYPYKYKRDDAAALYALQYAGADLCAADNALRTPLVLAAQCEYPYKYKRDDAAALYALQYAGADLCAADNALRTPLVLAAQCEYPYKYKRDDAAALYALQYAGADLCAADNALRTPLVLAAQLLVEKSEKKSPIKSKKLKEKEIKEDSKSKEETDEDTKEGIEEQEDSIASIEECKVEKASRENLMKFVRYLVAAGCDINIQGPEGMTALHIAAQGGDVELCTALLEAGDVSVDSRDLGGWTPLVWAAENDHVDVVRLLLSRGADATTRDAEGNGCVHWCALAGHARSLRLLLAAAPHAHAAPNAHKDTPLHVAARQGHYSCVVILLARGARTDVENSAGELPVEVCSGACQSVVSLNMQMALAAKGQLRRGKLLASDLSNGCETYALPCVNEVDDTPAPDDFTYVTDHVMPEPLSIDNTIQSMQGCQCKDGDCSGGGCACCVLSVRRWSSALGRLPPAFPHHDPPMMFECNATCACNKRKCGNMVISRLQQRGSLFIRAEVFRTARAGWGLRAVSAVPRGSPVALYCGELLPLARADARPNDQYLFALDVKPDLQQQCGDKGTLCVDACIWGSAARFINHSCAPNLAPLRVFTRARDLAAPVVALYAMRDVAAGEELTFDYGDKFWSVKSKWMKCECGSPECRYPVKSTEADA
ncbi:uncharacterized protein LOC135078036 [Ostrinia nubilalis]|uniref:uncharacterized protein LOC135078036 n=1 Tax=Ostrinia nubilalis TaxID=29057 RepID=UPI003082379C